MIEPRATPEYLAIVNEILPKAAAAGAYAIGLVTALAWQEGLDPSRKLLETAALAPDSEAAVSAFEIWRKSRQKPCP